MQKAVTIQVVLADTIFFTASVATAQRSYHAHENRPAPKQATSQIKSAELCRVCSKPFKTIDTAALKDSKQQQMYMEPYYHVLSFCWFWLSAFVIL